MISSDPPRVACLLLLSMSAIAIALVSQPRNRLLSYAASDRRLSFTVASPQSSVAVAESGAPIESSGPFTVFAQEAERPTVVVGNNSSETFIFVMINENGRESRISVTAFAHGELEVDPGPYEAMVLDPISSEYLARGTAELHAYRTYRVVFVPEVLDEIPTFHIGPGDAEAD